MFSLCTSGPYAAFESWPTCCGVVGAVFFVRSFGIVSLCSGCVCDCHRRCGCCCRERDYRYKSRLRSVQSRPWVPWLVGCFFSVARQVCWLVVYFVQVWSVERGRDKRRETEIPMTPMTPTHQ